MDKPNIIWIYCDELRSDALSCYTHGTMDVHTPNIEALAGLGVRFENCFCNSPICVSSRTSTLTALYPEDTGCYCNEGAWPYFRIDESVTTFPQVFAQHGYKTADFGKMHLPPQMKPWQLQVPDGAGMHELQVQIPEPLPHNQLGAGFPAGKPYPAEKVTRNALEWLSSISVPYLVRISFLQPHTPLFPPPPYDKMYMDLSFEDIHRSDTQLSAFEKRWCEIWRAYSFSGDQWRQSRGYYCGLVAWVDEQVGRILQFLRSHDQMDNTVIVFSSDHGTSKGEMGCGEKHIFAPHVHRVPLIIACPAGEQGQARHDLAQNMDLARTLSAMAQIDPPEQFKGRNLFGDPEPDAIFSTIGFGFPDSRAAPYGGSGDWYNGRGWPRRSCVRTRRYRLDKNMRMDAGPAPDAEQDIFLADTTNDPCEVHNIAGDPASRDIVRQLSEMLDRHAEGCVEPPHDYVTMRSPSKGKK